MAYKNDFGTIKNEIKNRADIVDVVGSVVSLKKRGVNYQGLCPFHNEKTPSFVVSEEKQIFTCFGCGATGDVIEFVKRYYNLTFQEALEKLANMYGIPFEYDNRYEQNTKVYYDINRDAAIYFYKSILKKPNDGLKYMAKRKLTAETIKTFGIGYADESWDSLYRYLKNKGYKEEIMLKAGLVSQSKNNKYYDKFRHRVMFPIKNSKGKVIGFGGRALEEEQMPKYLNSKETPIFFKKDNLYALDITQKFIREKHKAIVVEGYMDVISLFQGGIKNVVASLGTALTEEQAKLIKRHSHNIILSYDSDNAGQKATARGGQVLQKADLKVKVLQITDGKDPDEFIKANGKMEFEKLIDGAVNFGDYMIDSIKSKYDIETTDGRWGFLHEVAVFLSDLSPLEQDIYAEKLASQYSVSIGSLRTEISNAKKNNKKTYEFDTFENIKIQNQTSDERFDKNLSTIEKTLIKIMLTESRYFEELEEKKQADEIFESRDGKAIYNAIKELYRPEKEIDIDELTNVLDEKIADVLQDILKNIMLGVDIKSMFEECLITNMQRKLKERKDIILEQLSFVDDLKNVEKAEELMKELMDIQRKINNGGV